MNRRWLRWLLGLAPALAVIAIAWSASTRTPEAERRPAPPQNPEALVLVSLREWQAKARALPACDAPPEQVFATCGVKVGDPTGLTPKHLTRVTLDVTKFSGDCSVERVLACTGHLGDLALTVKGASDAQLASLPNLAARLVLLELIEEEPATLTASIPIHLLHRLREFELRTRNAWDLRRLGTVSLERFDDPWPRRAARRARRTTTLA